VPWSRRRRRCRTSTPPSTTGWTHIRSAGKFPDFLEIGVDVFYQVYDWHVRHNQQIQITRVAEQRFAIQWMFTQLILRWEQDPKYIGVPFDRAV
jgi:hypothetical protein